MDRRTDRKRDRRTDGPHEMTGRWCVPPSSSVPPSLLWAYRLRSSRSRRVRCSSSDRASASATRS
eukprot:32490-Chlamydomonas_euryale.AAC.1